MKLEWTSGNRLTLLENGDGFYPRVFAAIAAAQREVLLETFIWFDDPVGRALRSALLQAAANGARVHVLVDGWGSPDFTPEFLAPLEAAGVKLRAFEPVRRVFGARVNLFGRMHRKLLVVDGMRAFVGGINYSIDHLEEHGPQAKQDYAVEIEGPLVAHIHAFCRASLESTPQPARRRWLQRWRTLRRQWPEPPPSGTAMAAFVTRDNDQHRTDIEYLYRAALRRARRRVIIANAYFFPGWRLLTDLRRAARRGVRVELVLQGQPDMPIAQTAASMLYGYLTRAGVRVHEYGRRPLHGKVATVDDEWATVGSSNLDPTSLGLNLEANVVVHDVDFARLLRERLDELIAHGCQPVELPPAGALGSVWIRVRSFVVFHFLRRFQRWVRWLQNPAPKVARLQAEPR